MSSAGQVKSITVFRSFFVELRSQDVPGAGRKGQALSPNCPT